MASIDTKEFIHIKGAHLHNLKHLELAIPKNALIVITGVSGSGKSSLAFDTIYAEGQRRYVESLSSYARQFLGKLEKPKIEFIKGLAPAIAIQQKVISSNPRSTVGTTTEIYEYLKLLYARIGKTYSPVSGEVVTKDSVSNVIDYISSIKEGTQLIIGAPIEVSPDNFSEKLQTLKNQGFVRISIEGKLSSIEDLESFNFVPKVGASIDVIVDRIQATSEEQSLQRYADSIQLAFYEGKGVCTIYDENMSVLQGFSNAFEKDGILFNEPNQQFFSFNNPYGACPTCEGYGKVIGIDESLVVPNTSLSLYEEAIAPWKGEKMQQWKDAFIAQSKKFNFPIHKPYFELSEENLTDLWEGNQFVEGIQDFFRMVEENSYKIQYRVLLSRYRGKTKCSTCKGKRLRKETQYVKINQKAITDLVDLPLDELSEFFDSLQLHEYEAQIAKRLLYEIQHRLQFLQDVGLSYLTLNRSSNTLSGGESQRINLATSLGSSLVGSIYILDEPSIGLHSKDTERLIGVLQKLRDVGNTVIVVEHDEDMMKAADHLIDIGPMAGTLGGEIVYEGDFEGLFTSDSLTAQYLTHKREILVPKKRKKPTNWIEIKGAREHNLHNIGVKIPLQCLVVITGVSGSGKSTLIKEIAFPAISRELDVYSQKPGEYDSIKGVKNHIHTVELIDQNPIGKSSRSNPVTYVKAFDDIRSLYATLKQSKLHNYQQKHFSFNVEGGRCETCKGEGVITVEMQFMADIELPCEECMGKRFKDEILDITFHEKNIYDILTMTVSEALDFFDLHKKDKIVQKLKPLQDVGLGYLQLGQSSNTLSGGEAQRIKLASYLVKGTNMSPTLFIFDEPTTGLHFYDIEMLLHSFNALIENGHTVWVIEHQPDVIKCADWIIDIGPGGGKYGGTIVAEGTPETIAENPHSQTAPYIKQKLQYNYI